MMSNLLILEKNIQKIELDLKGINRKDLNRIDEEIGEIENKVIIDEPVKDKFTKEGQERFKSLYAAPKKIAKKLSARLSF